MVCVFSESSALSSTVARFHKVLQATSQTSKCVGEARHRGAEQGSGPERSGGPGVLAALLSRLFGYIFPFFFRLHTYMLGEGNS